MPSPLRGAGFVAPRRPHARVVAVEGVHVNARDNPESASSTRLGVGLRAPVDASCTGALAVPLKGRGMVSWNENDTSVFTPRQRGN